MNLPISTVLLWMATSSVEAFSTKTSSFGSMTRSAMKLQENPSSLSEKELREIIKDRNTKVEGDENYIATLGDGIDEDGETSLAGSTTTAETPSDNVLIKKIERILKPRAYPLFLMEKAAILMDDLFSSFGSEENQVPYGSNNEINNEREKIVILGTGWGAAAFLKDIDTKRFDVTVISPRNFFLFTPMLAGSSVGTVEYRSITEPIRQVCGWKIRYYFGIKVANY